MTTLIDYRDPASDELVWGCGGFVEHRFTQQDYARATWHWFPLLTPLPSMRNARVWDRFLVETITPWVWLSMPVHDPPKEH